MYVAYYTRYVHRKQLRPGETSVLWYDTSTTKLMSQDSRFQGQGLVRFEDETFYGIRCHRRPCIPPIECDTINFPRLYDAWLVGK